MGSRRDLKSVFHFSKTREKGEFEEQSIGWFPSAPTNGIVISGAQRPGGLNSEPSS